MSEYVSQYARVLGDVLRAHRKAKMWTRKDLHEVLGRAVSLQTLATYELGTRHISVDRLAQLAVAFGTQPHDILAEVDRRIFADPDKLAVNLAKLATSTRADIAPAAEWAAVRLAEINGTAPPIAKLSVSALHMLANDICHLDMAVLFAALREYAA